MIRALSEMNGVLCCGRPMRVSPATSRHERASSASSSPHVALSLGSTPPHYGASFTSDSPSVAVEDFIAPMPLPGEGGWVLNRAKEYARSNKPRISDSEFAADPSNTTVCPYALLSTESEFMLFQVFIGNLDASIDVEQLSAAFARFGPAHYVKVPTGKRVGFVQFQRKEDAVKAIEEMQGTQLGGSSIRLSWGQSHGQFHCTMDE